MIGNEVLRSAGVPPATANVGVPPATANAGGTPALQSIWYNPPKKRRKGKPHAAGSRRIRRAGIFLSDAARADAAEHVDAGSARRGAPGDSDHHDAAVRRGFHGGRAAADRRVRHGHGPAAALLHALPELRGRRGREGRGPVRFPRRPGDSRTRGRISGERGLAAGNFPLPVRGPLPQSPGLRPRARRRGRRSRATTTPGGNGSSRSAARSVWSISPT